MSRPKNKDEFRKELAEAFAGILEEKGLEWKKEWQGISNAPYNAITKAHYKGVNAFWLSFLAMRLGYNDPRWATMVQIMDKDGKYHPGQKWHLKAGSKATYVEYWYPFDLQEKQALTWQQYRDALHDGREPSEFALRTRYTAVFNGSMIEGMPELEKAPGRDIPVDQIIEKLSANMGVPILYDGGDRAYYSPSWDEIHLPAPEAFTSEYAFNATALHELAHSTGHSSRLNRPQGGFFGSAAYAYEELIAEMTSCFMGVGLRAELTAEHFNNHKAYVQSWVQSIKDKPETLVRAIKDAQAAASYMDWKAELISEKDYLKTLDSSFELPKKEARSIDLER